MSSISRKRVKVCNCKICDGREVPTSTAARHTTQNKFEESCKKAAELDNNNEGKYLLPFSVTV